MSRLFALFFLFAFVAIAAGDINLSANIRSVVVQGVDPRIDFTVSVVTDATLSVPKLRAERDGTIDDSLFFITGRVDTDQQIGVSLQAEPVAPTKKSQPSRKPKQSESSKPPKPTSTLSEAAAMTPSLIGITLFITGALLRPLNKATFGMVLIVGVIFATSATDAQRSPTAKKLVLTIFVPSGWTSDVALPYNVEMESEARTLNFFPPSLPSNPASESVTPSAASVSASVSPSALPVLCPNGVVDPGECCDDGNLINGDGCNSLCQLEPFVSVAAQSIAATGCGFLGSTSYENRAITVDESGNFYALYLCGTTMQVSTSTDRGTTWSAGVTITTGASPSGGAIEGGPSGIAYVAYIESGTIFFSKSVDSGVTWTTPASIGTTTASVLAMDSYLQNVYVMVNGIDIHRSSDAGTTFGVTSISFSFAFGEVIVDRSTGNVIVTADDPTFHVWVSTDGALTFGPELNPPGQAYYSEWAAGNGNIYVIGQSSEPMEIIPISNPSTSTDAALGMANFNVYSGDANSAGDFFAVGSDSTALSISRYAYGASAWTTSGTLSSDPVSAVAIAALPSGASCGLTISGAVYGFVTANGIFAGAFVF